MKSLSADGGGAVNVSPKLAGVFKGHQTTLRCAESTFPWRGEDGTCSCVEITANGCVAFPVLCFSGIPVRKRGDAKAEGLILISAEELSFGFGSIIAIFLLPKDIFYFEKVVEKRAFTSETVWVYNLSFVVRAVA